jgi:ribulose-phosphate 3-epimerase
MSSVTIYPSLISGDILNLEQQIKILEPHCDGFHIDVMDWHFVPNLTWGPMFINAIDAITNKPLFVHLMIDNVYPFLDRLILQEHDIVSFHIESTSEIEKIIHRIKEKNWRSSVAIKPNTPLEETFSFLPMVDMVLLMSVQPGFSGQQFLPESIGRLESLVCYREQHNLSFKIAMDGGINQDNIKELAQKGVDQVGIASGIFDYEDPVKALKLLHAETA